MKYQMESTSQLKLCMLQKLESRRLVQWHNNELCKHKTYELVNQVKKNNNVPSKLCRGLNKVLGPEDIIGSNVVDMTKIVAAIDCLDECGLAEIDIRGYRLTWCNKRQFSDINVGRTCGFIL
ncbi:hypothetical protein RIF29_05201 [Crotalaria pallida]|uniref:Uncharacterized protein n=1 Tax=Crotalaria pallida TaxID=3830 RepID=A0AAN9J2K7_CROPI